MRISTSTQRLVGGVAVAVALFFTSQWIYKTYFAGAKTVVGEAKGSAHRAVSQEASVLKPTDAETASTNVQHPKHKRPFRTPPASPLPASSIPLGERLVDLEQQAKAGDAAISYSLGLALKACFDLDAHYEDLQRAVEEKEVGGDAGLAMLKALDAKREACKGLSSDQLRSYGQWIELAAQQGNLNAQLAYPAIFGQLLSTEGHALDVVWIEKYNTNSMNFLQSAAGSGSIDALSQLAFVYDDGLGVPPDKARAYAYAYAVSLSGLVPSADKLLALWGQGMTPQEIQQAQVMGNSIYQGCCE